MKNIIKKVAILSFAFVMLLTSIPVDAASSEKSLKVMNTNNKEITSVDVVYGKTAKIKLQSYTGASKKSTKKTATSKNKKVATVKVNNSTATITGVKIGTTKLTLKDSAGVKSTITVNVIPTKPKIIKAARKNNGSVTLTWVKDTNATGYEIYRSYDGSNYSKIKDISKKTTTSFTDKISDTYAFYKIKSYKKVSGKKIYSSYSKVKEVNNKQGFNLRIETTTYKQEFGKKTYVASSGQALSITNTGDYAVAALDTFPSGFSVSADTSYTGKITYTLSSGSTLSFREMYFGDGYSKFTSENKVWSKVGLYDMNFENNIYNNKLSNRVKLTASAKINGKTYTDSVYIYIIPEGRLTFLAAEQQSDQIDKLVIQSNPNIIYELYRKEKESDANSTYKLVNTYQGTGESIYIRKVDGLTEGYYTVRGYIVGPDNKKYYGGTGVGCEVDFNTLWR